MSYLALYRVWRPQRFTEVVGQEKTVTALQNAIRDGKTSHAYLFTGPRGTGKTSIAKIIARAVNCADLRDGEPCNHCITCKDINNGNFMDVIEIDAASNRGIDEIRDLREKVRIMPAQGKTKVYIIDEVHMLTTEAFNALLKTIEEPPEAVIFILATTEPQKIPATIYSRCQVYNFRRLNISEIVERLEQVAFSNDISIEQQALFLIARRANGGMRDALSTMDQVFSYKGKHINKNDVLDVLGLVDDLFLAKLMDAVFDQNVATIVEMLGTALNEGKEAQQIVGEAGWYLRDLLLYSILGDRIDFSIIGENSRPFLDKQRDTTDKDKIISALKILMDKVEKLRFSEGNRFMLEMAFIEIMTVFADQEEKKQKRSVKKTKAAENRVKTDRIEARDILWGKILAGVKEKKIPTHALLSQGKLIGVKEDILYIGFKKGYKFHKERMEEKENREIAEEIVKDILAKDIKIQFIFLDDEKYNSIIVKKAIEYFGEESIDIKD
jgi:DNA polymerase-3 subunit gamma/tau